MESKLLSITSAIIVRNEEHYIQRCIKSVLPFSSEVVIIDTGSTDNTVPAICQLGCEKIKLIHSQWNDDFSYSRNLAIHEATGHYIFFIDADELITGDIEVIKDALKNNVSNDNVSVLCPQIIDHDHNKSYIPRIFPNDGMFYYSGYVHEELRRKDFKTIKNTPISVSIQHDGYRPDIFSAKEKKQRNMRLNVKNIQSEPEVIRWRYFYYRDGFDDLPPAEIYTKLKSVISPGRDDKNITIESISKDKYTFGILDLMARAQLRLMSDPSSFQNIIEIMNALLPGNSNAFYYHKLYKLLSWKKESHLQLSEILSFKKTSGSEYSGMMHSNGLHTDALLGLYLFECGYMNKSYTLLKSVTENGFSSGIIEQYLSMSSPHNPERLYE